MGNRRLVLTVLTLVSFAAVAVRAYDRYSVNKDPTNCRLCHGDFRAAAYLSLHDGQLWGSSLHDAHRLVMLGGDCDTCHSGVNRFPVLTDSSDGGVGFEPISCAGCHGRTGDENPPASGYGAGLRQHHDRNGVAVCATCHDDAAPANYTPVGEDTAPPYYFTPDPDHPDKPTDPCNTAGVGENMEGGPTGLDNDGDNLYDAADCSSLFLDGFESGDTSAWSSAVP